jgi:hypothetical protein
MRSRAQWRVLIKGMKGVHSLEEDGDGGDTDNEGQM